MQSVQLPAPDKAETGLGYSFQPPAPAEFPNYHRLSVWLRTQPTGLHYDPDTVICRVVGGQKSVETLIVRHPTLDEQSFQLALGLVSLSDRKGKKIEAFAFGGTLHIASDYDVTTCTFESPAPILALLAPDSLSDRLAAEVEALLARCRAQWNNRRSSEDFDQRLASIDPQRLYVSCLLGVQDRLNTIHNSDEGLHAILHFIDYKRHTLQAAGQWPLDAPALDMLLELN